MGAVPAGKVGNSAANSNADYKSYKIATIGSHSALQILYGARQEGFQTIAICEKGREQPYNSFKVADRIILVESFKELISEEVQEGLLKENATIVPHGTFIDALGSENMQKLKVPYFGNKGILKWEADRLKQREWLRKAGLTLPKIYKTPEEIDGPAIIKFYGARGGKGFFLARTAEEFYRKIRPKEARAYIIQEYVVGAPIYIHYFYSPLTDELEVMSFDRRYESNVDSIGRIAAKDQLDMGLETSYNITGNLPLVVRESLLPEIFRMGEAVVKASRKLNSNSDKEGTGLYGPFSLETVITPELKFFVFEISARIVAGTNLYMNGSPYTDLRYGGPMSTGRRIAREIRMAIEQGKLNLILN